MMPNEQALFVSWVRHAAPYIHAFRNRIFVIGCGGEVMQGDMALRLAHDCNLLASLGIRLVLVAGARPQIEAEMSARGLESRYHKGLRVTDAAALECAKRAMGALCVDIQALLSQGLPDTPMAGGAMRVAMGNFITAKPVGVVDGVDFQYTGAVRKVAAESLTRALEDHHVVLIAPFGVSPSGEVFNLSMEEVAERIAVALSAVKLIYLCDAPGVLDETGRLVSAMTADEAQRWLGEGRGITEDLGLYLPYAIRAVQNGVRRSHLIDRDLDGALLIEVFTPSGIGTVITEQALARVRDAGPEDVGSIVRLIAPLEADGTLVPRGRERLEMEIERFSVIEHDGMVVGCAALYPYIDEAVAELACVAVMPRYRQRGFGEIILAHMEQRARVAGLKKLLVLTTRTAHWFVERGFREVAVDALPASKRALYNMQRRSKVFVKEI